MRVLLLQGVMAGPAIAALVWLGLIRYPLLRRIVGIGVAAAANAAAWVVVWMAYTGDPPVWRSFAPTLLSSTLVALAEIAVLLVLLRVDERRPWVAAPTLTALAISTTVVAAAGYSGSLAVQAVLLPLSTIAAAVASLSGRGRRDARGLLGLAASDAVALVGLSIVFARTDTATITSSTGLGVGLILIAAAAKVGALPGLATWRLAATGGPGSVLAVAIRGHGMVLAVIGGVAMARGERMVPLAVGAAAIVFLAGLVSLSAPRPSSSLSSITGTAFGLPFLALGVGGAVGVRAFLVLFPVLLLASGIAALLASSDPDPDVLSGDPAPALGATEGSAPRGWAVLAAVAIGVALGSMLGAPPGGGFPGAWLAISLAVARAEATAWWLLIAGGAAVGLTLALSSSAGLIRSARPAPGAVVVSVIGAAVLLYAGTQPVRLAIGWWIRIETSLGVGEVLPNAGVPGLPSVGGRNLLLAVAPVLVMVALVSFRGLRVSQRAWVPVSGPARAARSPGRVRSLAGRATRPLAPVGRTVEQLRGMGVGFAIAAAFEVAAVVVAGRLVIQAAEAGFL
jgi:hypothetical protein